MPKKLGKYFIAIVPPEPVKEKITEIKAQVKAEFGVKYALRSPPHITLKMPFVFPEKKEANLEKKLGSFFSQETPFSLSLSGIGKFGERVIYLRVRYPPDLLLMQQRLVRFGKRNLGQKIELSDLNYTPHLTLAFKDIRKPDFVPLMNFLKSRVSRYDLEVTQVSLLKKTNSIWGLQNNFNLLK
ncbi:2'-5' RNA ligase [Cyclobacterium lianum]|uniref:2'-5' RNA ligase n=1 Tax=Cyclobacterium lianum TaxID=388280 RepID=A0A1M7JV55_9BACT|nr:2'-5' RNA ligase family protein [Cyclobacterium lianum]SHM56593.1 2'-5' RNA ligase [Cyclobacterium lianum]